MLRLPSGPAACGVMQPFLAWSELTLDRSRKLVGLQSPAACATRAGGDSGPDFENSDLFYAQSPDTRRDVHATSPRSIGFCAIWDCISSSSSSIQALVSRMSSQDALVSSVIFSSVARWLLRGNRNKFQSGSS